MKLDASYSIFSVVGRYRIRSVFYIALFWTAIDTTVTLLSVNGITRSPFKSLELREAAVFIMSCIMGYLFVFSLKNVFRNKSPFINFVFKSFILLIAAFVMNFTVHFIDAVLIMGKAGSRALQFSLNELKETRILIQKILYWLVLFVITQLYIDINEKYSPGVFMDIIMGKYMQPKIENRIVMFIDLKDSTPVAEKLGHEKNFKFIRDFVFHVSMALIEHGGRIYQYVGDEIVVSWLYEKKNTRKCMAAIQEARKNLQKNEYLFRRRYGVIPEFRVGIHMGEVTVGEIGVIKKDLAMSGDTMNTTARIRSACNELNQQFIMSKDFCDNSYFKPSQWQSLGIVELKGKSTGIELITLKI
jgi:adenylate cyclase